MAADQAAACGTGEPSQVNTARAAEAHSIAWLIGSSEAMPAAGQPRQVA
jgi:hypothetical protein